MIKLTNWQDWSEWSECKNEERTRFRSCVLDGTTSSDIDPTDNEAVGDLLSALCEVEKIETERQYCFTAKRDENKDQNLANSNPFMIEEEITASHLKRPKVNPEPVRVIEIHRG